MNKIGNGPRGWVLDNSAKDNQAERLLAHLEANYDQICERLCKSITEMQAKGDGDSLILLDKILRVALSDIVSYFGSKPIAFVGESTRAC